LDSRQFDVLILDVFSNDAAPAHLVNRGAFGIYAPHLRSDGLLAGRANNRHSKRAEVRSPGKFAR
jgi:spermidine synthase